MVRLRTADPSSAGWTVRGSGARLRILDQHGAPVRDDAERARVGALGIPPAWTTVWVAPDARAHIQAVGTDAAGRRQYIYHQQWQRARARQKYDRALELALQLPVARAQVTRDLHRGPGTRLRALGTAFRLLDSALLRVGSERYAQQHGSRGLTTLQGGDARVSGDTVLLEFVGKGAIDWSSETSDPDLAAAVRSLKRRGPEEPLLAWRNRAGWHPLRAEDVNAYVRMRTHGDFSAKDFRTLHGTVIAAQALAAGGKPESASEAARAIRVATKLTADALGNTPAIARGSYIDPRVFDRFRGGVLLETGARAPEPALRRLILGEPG